MKKFLIVTLLLAILSFRVYGKDDTNDGVEKEKDGTSKSSTEEMAKKLKSIQNSMYLMLRTIALPGAKFTDNDKPTQRFVLQVPGKQLNPLDYDPTNYTRDITFNRLSSFIPPVIEENMFRLTNIVPVANPLKGGETGESFSDLYESALNLLDVRSFQKKTLESQDRYKEAINYLAKPISDPDDLTKNTTRLGLYVRLQKRYNDIRLDMEDKIKQERDRHEDDPVKYQTWFQTHYPAMYANVENAYTEWLVFGEKDLVELYKAHLDVESQGVAVEEARTSLRSSGKVSLDRSSTIYPVHFEPSNWYEYLRAKPKPLSREQLQVKIGDIEARLTVLKSMKDTTPDQESKTSLNNLRSDQDDTEKKLAKEASSIKIKKIACKVAKHPAACAPFNSAQTEMATLANDYAKQKADADYAEFQLGVLDESDESIDGLIIGLEAQKKRYVSMLNSAVTEELDVPKTGSSEDDTQDFHAGWLQFGYDSSTRSKTQDTSQESYAASLSFSASGWGWGISGGASYSQEEQDFKQAMSQADLKISAKVLKVHVKRPWFKSSVFKFNDIITRTDQKISPGPMDEHDLIKSLESNSKTYLLPQFVNAFLLAKDVTMEFQGVDSSVQSHAFQRSVSAHLSGHYGPFSASASFNYGSSESSLRVQSTADGLHISIPGAQIIGYYVTVLPCFPKNTCPTEQ